MLIKQVSFTGKGGGCRLRGEMDAMDVLEVDSDWDVVEGLFEALASDRLEAFLSGCAEQLLVTFRGSGDVSTVLGRGDLPSWWSGLHFLAGGQVRTKVALVLSTGPSTVVVLSYRFIRFGVSRHFETVNYCTVRDGKLAAWFASPLDRREYAEAWGLDEADVVVPSSKRMVGAPTP
jgi:ketosteroid isomerase-like protein